jgi:hypothetical protein
LGRARLWMFCVVSYVAHEIDLVSS